MGYQVRPRYTPGSPAWVDEEIAIRVAKEEKRFYDYALTGVFGNDLKEIADTQGLGGIVVRREEKRGTLYYTDLLTGRTWEDRGIYNKRGPMTIETGARPDEVIQ